MVSSHSVWCQQGITSIYFICRSNNSTTTTTSEVLFSNKFLTPWEVGVNLKDGYNGDISAKDAGKIGGNMVRKMIQQAEQQMK